MSTIAPPTGKRQNDAAAHPVEQIIVHARQRGGMTMTMTQDEQIRCWQEQRRAKGLSDNWNRVQYASPVPYDQIVPVVGRSTPIVADELRRIRDANAAALRGGR
jgi:hypothetical protein